MSTPPPRWSPNPHNLLALAALVLLILAALAFHGSITGVDGRVLLASGLACIAAEGIVV